MLIFGLHAAFVFNITPLIVGDKELVKLTLFLLLLNFSFLLFCVEIFSLDKLFISEWLSPADELVEEVDDEQQSQFWHADRIDAVIVCFKLNKMFYKLLFEKK